MAATPGATVIAVKGLSEDMAQALSGVQLGDFLSFESRAGYDSGSADEESSDNDEEDSDEEEETASSSSSEDEDGEADDDEQTPLLGNGTPQTPLTFNVTDVVTNAAGNVIDLHLVKLHYHADYMTEHSFQIFGGDIHIPAPTPCSHAKDSGCPNFVSLTAWIEQSGDAMELYDLRLNPSGNDLRPLLADSEICPANCNDGFLGSLAELSSLLPPTIYTTPAALDHHPVCPVCIGLPLLYEQQSLRSQLESIGIPDVIIGSAVEFTGGLNQRRILIGYGFVQFDERPWGYLFEDMLSQDGQGHDGGVAGNNGFEHWDEAMDPNAGVVLHPASDATIAGLPKKPFAEVEARNVNAAVGEEKKAEKDGDEEPGTRCCVCMETYKAETMVVILSCGHFGCASGCMEQWLKNFDTCPVCRAKVLGVEETTNKGDSTDDDSADEEGTWEETLIDETTSDEDTSEEGDDEGAVDGMEGMAVAADDETEKDSPSDLVEGENGVAVPGTEWAEGGEGSDGEDSEMKF